MTEHDPGRTGDAPLGSWLQNLSDDALVRLLELRPDLAQPTPGSLAALAARAVARQSIRLAADDLDFLRLSVLDALLVLGADRTGVPVGDLSELLAGRAPAPDILAALGDLRDRALVWGEDPALRVAAEVAEALPWYPGQATEEHPGSGSADLAAAIGGLDESSRAVLERLAAGSPLGRTRDAGPGTPADRPVPQLLAAGLLRALDDETVLLPRAVGRVLRGETPGPDGLEPPDPVTGTCNPADADASAAGSAMELLREIEALLETLSAAPVPELRSGGLGVREARRLSKSIGLDEQRLGLILELAAAAGLIASGEPDPEPPDPASGYWAPTVGADKFLEAPTAQRWLQLATAWLGLPSRPGLVGERGPDGKIYAALSDSLYSSAAPMDRRLLLELLAGLPPGAGVDADSASRALTWRRPRWAARLAPQPVQHLLDEAHALGLTGRGALSSPAAALLAEGEQAAAGAMARILPAPVDHFLVQADLTVVVPGPLERDLAAELAVAATLESAGAAMVYRVSESSLRHALDSGRTAGDLQQFFARHSKTGVPQGLSYLIDDVARRHGRLRVGAAASFIRCEDPALLAHAVAAPRVADLPVRMLAPTVAVSPAPVAELLAALREAGFAPAAEDFTGAIVDLRRRGARVPASPARRPLRSPTRPGRETLAAVVAMLRRVSASPMAGARVDPAVAIALLQQAAIHRKDILMGYVDAAGLATQRLVTPISVHGGHLVAFDPAQGRLREFAVHRVTSVLSADFG